jgi:hypothetical protein
MGYESCASKYASYFTPKLKDIFREAGWSIPYILDLVDEPCEDRECSHHVFSSANEIRNLKLSKYEPVDMPWTLQCRRCMCLLDLIPRYLSSTEIADVFGVTRQAINLIEHSAIKKIQRKIKLMDEPFAKGGTTVRNNLPSDVAIPAIA